jgi:hypothetical protein
MPAPVQEPSRPDADRYEPLPGITGLPGWLWRRLPKAGKVVVALLPLALVALALLLGPGIDRSKDEREQARSERLARQRAERNARLRLEQRPRFGRGPAAGADIAQRTTLLREARSGVEDDARRRVAARSLEGPVRWVTCAPHPPSVEGKGDHLDPAKESGNYACLAVTSEVPVGEGSEGGAIGHPYRLRIDFGSGRYALCKVSGQAGEGASAAQPPLPVPRACGGA